MSSTLHDIRDQVAQTLSDQAGCYDIDAIIRDAYEYNPASSEWECVVDETEYWQIVATHDLTEQQKADATAAEQAAEAAGEALRQQIADAARRHIATIKWGDFMISYSLEFREGGFDKWPTSEHFKLTIARPDGEATVVGTEVGSWRALHDLLDEEASEWKADQEVMAKRAERALVAAAERRAAAQAELDAARAALDPAIRAALDTGMTAYRAAKITGLAQTTVARVRKGE